MNMHTCDQQCERRQLTAAHTRARVAARGRVRARLHLRRPRLRAQRWARQDRPAIETAPWVLTVREAEYIAARFGPVEIAGDAHPAWAG